MEPAAPTDHLWRLIIYMRSKCDIVKKSNKKKTNSDYMADYIDISRKVRKTIDAVNSIQEKEWIK